jgi:hypothetical protein
MLPFSPTFIALGLVATVCLKLGTAAARGEIWWRWWALLPLGISLWLAFPFSLITLPYLYFKHEVLYGRGFAPWITSIWIRGGGLLVAPLWLFVLFLIPRVGGVRFISPVRTRVLGRGLTAVLVIASALDMGMLFLGGKTVERRPLARAVSPNGRLSATLFEIPDFLDSSYCILLRACFRSKC